MKFETSKGKLGIEIRSLIVAGWTGRDNAVVNHHIAELARIGVTPPSTVPLYYRVAASMLTRSGIIEVLDKCSSGEAEPLLIRSGNQVWLGLASDHTDRKLEAYSVAHSKQACPKPVAAALWDLSEVRDHLDELVLRSWIVENGEKVLYQDGTLASILPLDQLLESSGLGDKSAMLCGTLPAIGGVRGSGEFLMELSDPVLDRRIHFAYQVETLPVVA